MSTVSANLSGYHAVQFQVGIVSVAGLRRSDEKTGDDPEGA